MSWGRIVHWSLANVNVLCCMVLQSYPWHEVWIIRYWNMSKVKAWASVRSNKKWHFISVIPSVFWEISCKMGENMFKYRTKNKISRKIKKDGYLTWLPRQDNPDARECLEYYGQSVNQKSEIPTNKRVRRQNWHKNSCSLNPNRPNSGRAPG